VAAIRTTKWRTQTKSAFREIQPISHRASDAIVFLPAHMPQTHAPFANEALEQTADRIICEGSNDRRVLSKAPMQTAGNVVLAATFPSSELACCRDTRITGVKAQHHFP
jgi:hypothetical protein